MFKYLAEIYVTNEKLTRQTGKTTVLMEACRKIGGTFITHSAEQATVLKKKYPDVSITYPSLLTLRGMTRPIIFDHYLLSLILSDKLDTPICNQGTKYLKEQLKLIKEELVKRSLATIYIGVNAPEIEDF